MANSDRRARAQQIDRVYSDGHPAWERIVKPVLELLQRGPVGWPEMDAFAKARGMSGALFGNCLAWLENRGLVESFYASENTVLWVATSVRWRDQPPNVSKDEVPEHDGQGAGRNGREPELPDEEEDGESSGPEEPERREHAGQHSSGRHVLGPSSFDAAKRAATR